MDRKIKRLKYADRIIREVLEPFILFGLFIFSLWTICETGEGIGTLFAFCGYNMLAYFMTSTALHIIRKKIIHLTHTEEEKQIMRQTPRSRIFIERDLKCIQLARSKQAEKDFQLAEQEMQLYNELEQDAVQSKEHPYRRIG